MRGAAPVFDDLRARWLGPVLALAVWSPLLAWLWCLRPEILAALASLRPGR